MKRQITLAGFLSLALFSLVVGGAGTPVQNADATATAAIQQADAASTPRMGTAIAQTTALVPTATTAPTATMAMPTGTTMPGMWTNTCHDLGDGAVDQNGVSVDVWAPGLRIACGFPGYENGDNPMPAGTLMPAPRPFRFDSAVDHNEPVFGFKVYYRKGSEAPAGYGGTAGCGDVRVIMHAGTEPHGFTTQYHTFQYTEVACDAQGTPHIVDIGGQIDTGTLFLRSLPDSQRPDGPNRTTADTLSCDQKTSWICATVWYEFFNYQIPGGSYVAWQHNGFLTENPIALYNANDPVMHYAPGPGNGTTTMLRDVQRSYPSFDKTKPDWCAMWNTTTHVNEVAPCTTPGSWQMHVDPYFSGKGDILEPASGTDHPHPVAGVKYPN